MSRDQGTQAFNADQTAASTYGANAKTAIGNENASLTDYQNKLAAFQAADPYKAGGEFARNTNTLATTAIKGSGNSTDQALEDAAGRTNTGSSQVAAASADMDRERRRDLTSFLTNAEQSRIGNEAGYQQQVLGDSLALPGAYQGEYQTSSGAQNTALGNSGAAAQQPSFWDTFGNSFAGSLGKSLGTVGATTAGGGAASIGCWIAEVLFGINTLKTMQLRAYLNGSFKQCRFGSAVMKLYVKYGETVADVIRRHPPIGWLFQPFFEVVWMFAKRSDAPKIHRIDLALFLGGAR